MATVTQAELDPGMFRQVLVNLLTNAVKFTPEEGEVEVITERDGDNLLVHVRDTGIGIAEADANSIFEEFYQVDGSYSRNYGGTGLGLAICQRIVAAHGGTIRFGDPLLGGASIYITLPIQRACVSD